MRLSIGERASPKTPRSLLRAPLSSPTPIFPSLNSLNIKDNSLYVLERFWNTLDFLKLPNNLSTQSFTTFIPEVTLARSLPNVFPIILPSTIHFRRARSISPRLALAPKISMSKALSTSDTTSKANLNVSPTRVAIMSTIPINPSRVLLNFLTDSSFKIRDSEKLLRPASILYSPEATLPSENILAHASLKVPRTVLIAVSELLIMSNTSSRPLGLLRLSSRSSISTLAPSAFSLIVCRDFPASVRASSVA